MVEAAKGVLVAAAHGLDQRDFNGGFSHRRCDYRTLPGHAQQVACRLKFEHAVKTSHDAGGECPFTFQATPVSASKDASAAGSVNRVERGPRIFFNQRTDGPAAQWACAP